MFSKGRANGKSDADVLLEVVSKASPGDVIEYHEMCDALSKDSSRDFDVKAAQSVVNRAERRIAVERNCALISVRNKGYKVALASEHQKIAGKKRERSSKLLKRGLLILQHVDWNQMDDEQRRAHEGQLMIIGAIHSAVTGIEQRLSRVEQAIKNRDKEA